MRVQTDVYSQEVEFFFVPVALRFEGVEPKVSLSYCKIAFNPAKLRPVIKNNYAMRLATPFAHTSTGA